MEAADEGRSLLHAAPKPPPASAEPGLPLCLGCGRRWVLRSPKLFLRKTALVVVGSYALIPLLCAAPSPRTTHMIAPQRLRNG